eukprot:Skav222529  [mRNA]  locus=scaffold2875:89489:89812:+ [translate_table: standard]
MPPFVCVRVRGVAAMQQPAKKGPLLVHCGGPGSGRDCGIASGHMNLDINGEHSIDSDFDILSIDQRGVNISKDKYETEKSWGKVPSCPFEQAGKAVKPFPTMYCNLA